MICACLGHLPADRWFLCWFHPLGMICQAPGSQCRVDYQAWLAGTFCGPIATRQCHESDLCSSFCNIVELFLPLFGSRPRRTLPVQMEAASMWGKGLVSAT